MWTIPDDGDSMSVGESAAAEGSISFTPSFSSARQSIPTTEPEKYYSFSSLQADTPDPDLPGDIPDVVGGFEGETVGLESVAPYHNGPNEDSSFGRGGPGKGHGGYVLGAGRPD